MSWTLRIRGPNNGGRSLWFSFQEQTEIGSKTTLFHKQTEPWIPQAIRDALPYFLGAVDEDRMRRQSQLDIAKRNLRRLERRQEPLESSPENHVRAQRLLDEAKQVGLVALDLNAETTEEITNLLSTVSGFPPPLEAIGLDHSPELVAQLRLDRQEIREQLEAVKAEITQIRIFHSESQGFEREALEQRARLSAVGLLPTVAKPSNSCPLCEQPLEILTPSVTVIRTALEELESQLITVSAERPRLQARLGELQGMQQQIVERLRSNQQRLAAVLRSDESGREQDDLAVARYRVDGRISLFLEVLGVPVNESSAESEIQLARAQVEALEEGLDQELVAEKLGAFLNIISGYMNDYSSRLGLEYSADPVRLDIRLTCPRKTGPEIMRVLEGIASQGGQHAPEPVYAGADRRRLAGA